MKRFLSNRDLDKVAEEFRSARREHISAEMPTNKEYFLGKMVGIIEAYAVLLSVSFVEADVFLRKRADELELTKKEGVL